MNSWKFWRVERKWFEFPLLLFYTLFVLIFARINFRAFSRTTSICAKLNWSLEAGEWKLIRAKIFELHILKKAIQIVLYFRADKERENLSKQKLVRIKYETLRKIVWKLRKYRSFMEGFINKITDSLRKWTPTFLLKSMHGKIWATCWSDDLNIGWHMRPGFQFLYLLNFYWSLGPKSPKIEKNKQELQCTPVDETWIVIPFEMKCQTNFTLNVITLLIGLFRRSWKKKFRKILPSPDDLLKEKFFDGSNFTFDVTFRIGLFGSV